MMRSTLAVIAGGLTLAIIFGFFSPSNALRLRIGAFNIQTFGKSKYGNPEKMEYIIKILRRYDVCLVQEIKDVTGLVIPGVLEMLQSNGEKWAVLNSERLGLDSNSYREQYAYYYRTDKLTAVSEFQYDDGVDDGSDDFEREPYGVMFEVPNTIGLKRFGLIGCHIKPDSAVKELNAMVDVFAEAGAFWNGLEDIMVMGDFNAGCSYVNKEELASLDLKTDKSYLWIIGDNVDTTSSTTNCPYDRMIATGDLLKKSLDLSTGREYRFDDAYGLDYDTAKGISDHYPVEVEMELLEPPNDAATLTHSAPRFVTLVNLLLLVRAF